MRKKREAKKEQRQEKREAQGGSNVKVAVKKAVSAAKKGLKSAVLLPYRTVMVAALKAKGVTPKTDMDELAVQFYDVIISKDKNFQGMDMVEAFSNFEIRNDRHDKRNFDPITISTIVSAIVSWIQQKKEAKAQGAKLSNVESAIVETSDKVEVAAKDYAEGEVKETIGEKVIALWPVITVILVAVVGVILWKAFSK